MPQIHRPWWGLDKCAGLPCAEIYIRGSERFWYTWLDVSEEMCGEGGSPRNSLLESLTGYDPSPSCTQAVPVNAKIISPPPPPYSPFLSAALPTSSESSVQIRWHHSFPENFQWWQHFVCTWTFTWPDEQSSLKSNMRYFSALSGGLHSAYTHAYVQASAYLSSCSQSCGSEHRLQAFAAGLHTCTYLVCTAQTDEPAVMSHWMWVRLQNIKVSITSCDLILTNNISQYRQVWTLSFSQKRT